MIGNMDTTRGQVDKEIRASDKTVSGLFKDSTMISTRIVPDHKFLLDSGASGHMVRKSGWFINMR